jgi:mannosyltransferase
MAEDGTVNKTPGMFSLSENWPLLILLLAQLAIVAPGLVQSPLWLDEAYSALLARLPVAEQWQALRFDAGPPLYYMILRGWRFIAGESEIALRGLSLLFSLATTVSIFLFSQRFVSKFSAYIAAGFWAFAPLSVYYAHTARNYTLFALVGFWFIQSVFCYATAPGNSLHSNQKFFPWRAVVFLLLMVYTHNMGWFLAVAVMGAAVATTRNVKTMQRCMWMLGIGILGYLPWLPTLLHQIQHTHFTIAWIQDFWSAGFALLSLFTFIPGGFLPGYIGIPFLPSAIQAILIVLCFGALISLFFKKNTINSKLTRFLSITFLLGLAMPYAYSLLFTPVHLPGRTDFCLYPIWSLLFGFAVASIPRDSMRWSFLGIFVFCAVSVSYLHHTTPLKKSEYEIVRYLSLQGKAGDTLLCTDLSRPVLEYYLRPKGFSFVSYPSDMANHLAHINESWYLEHGNLEEEADNVLVSVPPGKTMWVVGSQKRINKPLLDRIALRWPHSKPIQTPGMGIQLLNQPLFLLRIYED